MSDALKKAIKDVKSANITSNPDLENISSTEKISDVKKKFSIFKNAEINKAQKRANERKKEANEQQKSLRNKEDNIKKSKKILSSTARTEAKKVVPSSISKPPINSTSVKNSLEIAKQQKQTIAERQSSSLLNLQKNLQSFKFPMRPSIALGFGSGIVGKLTNKTIKKLISESFSKSAVSPLDNPNFPYCNLLENSTAKTLCVRAYEHGITDKIELAQFLAQAQVETRRFTSLEENLYYTTAGRAVQVYNSVFKTLQEAVPYLANPEKLANKVYSNRDDLGNRLPDDGYRYRGRGFLHLTGKYNYQQFEKFSGKQVVQNPSYVSTFTGAVESALWFWDKKVKPRVAEFSDSREVTRRVKGSDAEYDIRNKAFQEILELFTDEDDSDIYYH